MARSILLIFTFVFLFSASLKAQERATYELFLKFSEYYKSGDFINAETALTTILNSENPPEAYLVAAFNNLGLINFRMAKFEKSLKWYEMAEAKISNKENSVDLAGIYINKATIFLIQKSYETAIEYLVKGIDIYLKTESLDQKTQQKLSTAYMNLGIVYYTIKDYRAALKVLERSFEINSKNDINENGLLNLNFAKIYAATSRQPEATKYYQKGIADLKKEFGEENYRLAGAYFDYGLFLESEKVNDVALLTYKKALSVCKQSYGEKHNITSLAYKHIADFFLKAGAIDSAIIYFQKSLISVVADFYNTDTFSNPSLDSVIFNITLLDNLKGKAKALELLADHVNSQELKILTMEKSLETIELALQLIDRIRINYLNQESKMYLAENEKETYLFAIHIAGNLHKLTSDTSFIVTMFSFAQKSKAAVLRNEISENEYIYNSDIPDSLKTKQYQLSENISAYDNMVLEELKKNEPDSKKITLWKDAIFGMKRENEKLKDLINKIYPRYYNLLQKAKPATLIEIQQQLSKDETVVDYILAANYNSGKRKMYIFLVSKERLDFLETEIDTLMAANTDIIFRHNLVSNSRNETKNSFSGYTSALFYMYCTLIRPVESLIKVKRLIIIPDEETGLLPFDAFLKGMPAKGTFDFENLQYLVNDYSFSFGYSTSMIFGDETENRFPKRIIAFTPDYNDNFKENTLPGAKDETKTILKLFRGTEFSGRNATKQNFLEVLKTPAIFHLAMHSLSDTSDSKFSYLFFDHDSDSLNEGKLFNYEISLNKIKSPMVVLSACNSGMGKLYRGEGVMSLARGFILAGASSVVRTKWEVNDESSSFIIKRFYYHLSNGKPKDESMRLAKLDFINGNSPNFRDPYYWAGYEVLGDNSQIAAGKRILIPLISVFVLFLLAVLYFLNRRRIFSARSR